jgi:hypothetical protein
MKTLVVPKFESDEKEAQWWDAHMDIVEENLSEAMRNGTAGRGTAQRVLQETREAERIVVPAPDLERARKLSRRKKVDHRQYILALLHKALLREEAAQRRAARRKTA